MPRGAARTARYQTLARKLPRMTPGGTNSGLRELRRKTGCNRWRQMGGERRGGTAGGGGKGGGGGRGSGGFCLACARVAPWSAAHPRDPQK
eukprot:9468242-Pyramimonas_sp.AAC.2